MYNPDVDPPQFTHHAGVDLAYWDYGEGPRTLLLVMGINMRAAHFGRPFIEGLAQRFRVLCFDNRGTGSSTKPVQDITPELWAGDALAVLDAAGVERAHVLGTSMGGRVAQQIAVTAPERVDHLVLVVSVFGGREQVLGTPEALQGFKPQPDIPPDEQRRRAIRAITGPSFAAQHPERLEAIVELGSRKRTPVAVLMKQLGVGRENLGAELATCALPTLIIHGNADTLVPIDNGRLIHAAIPGSRFAELDGIGHLPAWEAPEQLLALVHDFLPND